MNVISIITNMQWALGILALGLYGGIEQAEGWQILFNLIMLLMVGTVMWLLTKLKEVIADEQKAKGIGVTRKVSQV